MKEQRDSKSVRRRFAALNAIFLALGLALLVAQLVLLDVRQVLGLFPRIGWMLVPAFLAYVSANFTSALTWQACVEPTSSRASYWDLARATWAAHAMNAVTPGGGVGEVLKGTLLRDKIEGRDLVASILLYNVINTSTVTLSSVVGGVICVLWLDAPLAATLPILIGALVIAGALGIAVWLVHRSTISKLVGLFRRLPFLRARTPEGLAEQAKAVDESIRRFFADRPSDVLRAFFFALVVRLIQIGEIGCLLMPLAEGTEYASAFGTSGVFLISILAATTSNLAVWSTFFVPGQVGTLEAANGWIFQLAGLDPAWGVVTVLARRVRTFLGIGLGLALGGRVAWEAGRAARARAEAT